MDQQEGNEIEDSSLKKKLCSFFNIVKIVLLYIAGIALVVALTCLLVGWHSIAEYATALKYTSLAIVGLGCLSVMSTSNYQMPPEVMVLPERQPHERINEYLRGKDDTTNFFFLMCLVAVAIYGLAELINKIIE